MAQFTVPRRTPVSEHNPTAPKDNEATERLSEKLSDIPSKKGELTTTDQESLDLTRYKTAELKKRFENLFGLTRLLPWAVGGLGGCMLLTISIWILLFAPRAGVVIASISLIYLFFQGFFLGVLAASLLVVARLLQQLGAIVDMTIQTLREALRDLRKIGDDRTSRAELTAGLVHGAILPAAQSVITIKMGLLRLPISFVINRLLKRTAKKLTKTIDKKEQKLLADLDSSTDDIPEHAPPSELKNRSAGESNSSMIKNSLHQGETHLDRMQERVDLIARRTRGATLIPAAIFFSFIAIFSSLPWLLVFVIFL